jgi:hypothetical protein
MTSTIDLSTKQVERLQRAIEQDGHLLADRENIRTPRNFLDVARDVLLETHVFDFDPTGLQLIVQVGAPARLAYRRAQRRSAESP